MLAMLANAAIDIIPFLVIITFVVTIHELGHFLTARAFGVAVDRFSIGFGRALLSFKDRWGVEWRFAWLPLGGYVKFAGDENVASVPDQEDLASLRSQIALSEGVGAEKRYFYFKPLWQRALVVVAGPAANFVLAIALFAILIGAFGEPIRSTKITEVVPGAPAALAGVKPGDVITAVDGHAITNFEDLVVYVEGRDGVPIQLTVQRAGHPVDVALTPAVNLLPSPMGGTMRVGYIGLGASGGTIRHYGPIGAVVRGVHETWSVVESTGYYIGRLVSGKVEWQFGGVFGGAHAAATITHEAIDVAQTDHVSVALTLMAGYFNLAALLSVSLGLLNLLPVPVLDGGHLLFYAYEFVARRPMAARVQAAGYRVGLALLVGLMLFTTWHDLQRLQAFHFLSALFS